jgi:septum formation protein
MFATSSSLLLASNSPRRRDLLKAAGFAFESISPEISEQRSADLTLRELTILNAIRKGISIARVHPQKVVLAADTLVAIKNEVIGKPSDLAEARKILRRLSGRVHEVCSSVFICHLVLAKSMTLHEISRVRFRRLNKKAIDGYLAKIDPLDKAGAYAAQGYGSEIIAGIEGSYSNVVGLPMEETVRALADFGVRPSNF